MAKVAIVHTGLDGHTRPAIRLGRVLAELGHDVVEFAPERYRAEIEGSGAELVGHDPAARWWPISSLQDFAVQLAATTARCGSWLIEQLHSRDVDVIVHDCHAVWGRVAGDVLGVPRVVSSPLFPGFDPSRPGLGLSSSSTTGQPRLANPSPGTASRMMRLRSILERRWGVELGTWAEVLISEATHTVSYTTELIAGRPAPTAGWRYIGPLMPERAPEATAAEVPTVYVAFGTAVGRKASAFRLAIEALADQPFEVIVSTGGWWAQQFGHLPANVTVREFVDQRAVLAGASVHVTHAGNGAIHESLLAGVPMVCLPVRSDQFHWMERVQQLGVGIRAQPDPDALRSAVLDLIDHDSARERSRELGRHLSAHDGKRAIARLIDDVLAADTACGASQASRA